MKTFYQCGVCGYISSLVGDVESCEAQGKKRAKFAIGDRVTYTFYQQTFVTVKARVEDITFEERSHEIVYHLRVTSRNSHLTGQVLQAYEDRAHLTKA